MTTLRELPLATVPVVEPQTSVAEVVALLDETPLGMVVLVGDEMYFGIFTTADLTSGRLPSGTGLDLLQVGPYVRATRPLRPEQPLDTALASVVHKGTTGLPVVDGNRYLGIATRAALEAAL